MLVPATVDDYRYMLQPALDDPDPVLIFEHALLYNAEGEYGSDPVPPVEQAVIRRPGSDITVITYGGSLAKSLDAAEQLSAEGVDAEVIDLRCLRPLDDRTYLDSVQRTHRAVIVDEGWRTGSISAEISARITEHAFYDLDAPVVRVCSAEVPMPYPKHLEDAALPSAARVVAGVREALAQDA